VEYCRVPFVFPRAFAYKTPLPVLCLLALAVFAAIARRESWRIGSLSRINPLAAFALVYGAIAIGSQLNIGHRHILPIYPVLFIGCGAIAYGLRTNQRAVFAAAAAVFLLWQIGESFAIRPNYLAYFNEAAGGPSRGYKHLVDSSLDWGQDLPALKSWIDDHRGIVGQKPFYLAYFGTADPRAYEIDAKSISPDKTSRDQTFERLNGGIYCVSATTLQSVYALEIGPWCMQYEQSYQTALAEARRYRKTASDPSARVELIANDGAVPWQKKIKEFERLRFERLCAYLRHHPPVAQIGYSIFVFDLSDDEITSALYGPPVELAREICVTGY